MHHALIFNSGPNQAAERNQVTLGIATLHRMIYLFIFLWENSIADPYNDFMGFPLRCETNSLNSKKIRTRVAL